MTIKVKVAVACVLASACGGTRNGGPGAPATEVPAPGVPATEVPATLPPPPSGHRGHLSIEGAGSISGYWTLETKLQRFECSSSCDIAVNDGATLRIGASPASGWMFKAWGGACAGLNRCEVKSTGDFSVSVGFSPAPPRRAPQYTALDISSLAGDRTLPMALGDDGSVAGLVCSFPTPCDAIRWDASVSGLVCRVPTHCDAFLWSGALQRFPIADTFAATVSGANGGRVVGTLLDPATRSPRTAFVSQGDRLLEIGNLAGVWSMAHGVNSAGAVVGTFQTQSRDLHAFVWENGVARDLTEALGKPGSRAFAIDDAGTIAAIACDHLSREQESGGSFDLERGCRGVLLRDGAPIDLGPLPSHASVTAMSPSGQAVLGGVALWTEGSVLDEKPLIVPYAWPGIDWLAGGFSIFEPSAILPAVNASGQAVGKLYATLPDSDGRVATAVLLQGGQLHELGPRATPALRLHSAYAIDGRGRILARDSFFDSTKFFLLTPAE